MRTYAPVAVGDPPSSKWKILFFLLARFFLFPDSYFGDPVSEIFVLVAPPRLVVEKPTAGTGQKQVDGGGLDGFSFQVPSLLKCVYSFLVYIHVCMHIYYIYIYRRQLFGSSVLAKMCLNTLL